MADPPLLALLEPGRAPQPQMEAEFRRVLGDACDIRTFGALDHLSDVEISAHRSENGADTLFTTLPPDHRVVLVSKRLVIDGLRRCIRYLQSLDAGLAILCCTGGFPEIESPEVLKAADIVSHALGGQIAAGSTLGVFVPEQEHAAEAVAQRAALRCKVVCEALSPDAPDADIEAASVRMRQHTPDLVLYDCMGYTRALQSRAEAVHSIPGILAVEAAAGRAARRLGIHPH